MKRPDMREVHNMYMAMMNQGKVVEATSFAKVVAGGMWHNARLFKHDMLSDPSCDLCHDGESQHALHLFYECKA
eukprot:10043044-Lingulodinium_polyedra.AAC.1